MKELDFEAFQFTSDVNKLKEWLNEVNFSQFSRQMSEFGELNV